jgi:hypothetical protein
VRPSEVPLDEDVLRRADDGIDQIFTGLVVASALNSISAWARGSDHRSGRRGLAAIGHRQPDSDGRRQNAGHDQRGPDGGGAPFHCRAAMIP